MNNFVKDRLSQGFITFIVNYLRKQGVNTSEIIWKHLSGDGSERMIYRLSYSKGSVVAVINDHAPSNDLGINENDSFYYISHHLRSKGIGTPEIFEYQRDKGWFILEDLGDVHLQDEALKIKHDPVRLEELYKRVLNILPLIQVKGAQGFDINKIHSLPYDGNFVRKWESGYFFHSFLRGYLNLDIKEDFLRDEFDALADKVSSMDSSFFLYRDFQSKNIMIKQEEVCFLDFQGGRRGPLHYDLSSLLLDPYIDISDKLNQTLMEYYLKQLRLLVSLDEEKFLSEYPFIALHRNMQILAAFAYLSKVKKKYHFTKYIPTAIKSLKKLCNLEIFSSYKNLRKLVEEI